MRDAILGFMFGMFFMYGIAVKATDVGRDDCEKNLPRTERCIKIWIPEKEKLNVDTAN